MSISWFPFAFSSTALAAPTASRRRGIVTAIAVSVTLCCAVGFIGSPRLRAAESAPAPAIADPTSKVMKTYVIFRRSGWDSSAELSKAGARSSEVGLKQMSDRVRWIRSYVTDEGNGRVGTICIYEAVDVDAVREHARRAGLPCDVVVPVLDTVIINPAPVQRPKP